MATPSKPANPPPTANGPAAVAKIDEKTVCSVQQLRGLFDAAIPQLAKALPAQLRKNAERMARCAVTEFQRNESLAKCTGLSILACAIQAAQLGLEIGGPTGQSYMVPYGNKATFQIGYRGMITLAFRSGEVSNIYASVVREKDKFRMLRGTSPGIDHEPATVNAGAVIGAYAVVVYTTGQINFEYMTRDEIEHHRKTYSKQPNSMLWTSAWNEGAKKTVLRKLLKHCPLSVDFPEEGYDAPPPADAELSAASLLVPSLPAAVEAEPEPPADDGTGEPRQGSLIAETDASAQAK